MYKTIFILCLLLINTFKSTSQKYEKITLSTSDEQNYFISIPPQDPAKGALILMPGFGQYPEGVIAESKIPDSAYINGIHTFLIAGGNKLHMDESVKGKLDEALELIKRDYQFKKDQFIIGGFSAGGTISLRYAEHCKELGENAVIQPRAVFTVDSPVDLIDIWRYFDRELERNFSAAGTDEARFVKALMLEEIGDPAVAMDEYKKLNPFDSASKEPGNEQFLTDMGVRVYHDIDVNWLLKERGRSLYDCNALAASELINRLLLSGNMQAEFMMGNTGYRSSGLRHPHSWSIVDEVEFIQWTQSFF